MATAAAATVINDIKENSSRLFEFVLSPLMPCSMINRMVYNSDQAERKRRSFAEKYTLSLIELYIVLYALGTCIRISI